MKRRTFVCGCCGLIAGCTTNRPILKLSKKGANMEYTNIAACGLNCLNCEMFKLPTDKTIQDKMIPYFRQQTWLKENEGIETILSKNMYCKGCNVDQKVFWSKGACKIVECCKDTKKFSNCSECSEFPCIKSSEFSKQGGKYKEAFDYLISLKQKKV